MPNLKLLKVKSEIALRKMGNKFGVDVKMTDEEIFLKQLNFNNINLIFDVGANTGQFGELIYKMGYIGDIVSFEPLSSAYNILKKRANNFKAWTIAERCAIGDFDGETKINISENSISSSVLNILNEHTSAAPGSKYVGTETVQSHKLDTIGHNFIKNQDNIFLKIDTQGFESKILDGATEFIKGVKGMLIETSLVKLYEGQALFPDIYERALNAGFKLWGIQPAFVNKKSGRLLQADLVFFR